MGFVIPMMLAMILALTVVGMLGFAVLRESNLVAVFHEERVEPTRR